MNPKGHVLYKLTSPPLLPASPPLTPPRSTTSNRPTHAPPDTASVNQIKGLLCSDKCRCGAQPIYFEVEFWPVCCCLLFITAVPCVCVCVCVN
jgi:hypothetical protein